MTMTPLIPAVFGLIGVIVGGVISAVSTYLVDERRAARERAKDARTENLEIIRAARALDQDMDVALVETRGSLTRNERVKKPHNPVTLDGWRTNAQIIAPKLSLEAWEKLTLARM